MGVSRGLVVEIAISNISPNIHIPIWTHVLCVSYVPS